MIPPEILEWAVWATLDEYKNTELLLLKGHLLVEVALSHAVDRGAEFSRRQVLDMSFHRKVTELQMMTNLSPAVRGALVHAKDLNTLRNKLAHEPFVEGIGSELTAWADRVLEEFPSQKFQRFTPRTKATQAMASLARVIYAPGHAA